MDSSAALLYCSSGHALDHIDHLFGSILILRVLLVAG